MLLAATLPLAAESINPPTRPQAAPMTAQEKKNLDMVMTWWREVLYAGHFEVAPKYQAEDYIQHNPNANTGRAGFIDYFTKLGRKPINPIPKAMPADQLPVVSGARGDFVWLIF
jgi:predicted SnoaL-like aldol condensation-catalyzing enzyme